MEAANATKVTLRHRHRDWRTSDTETPVKPTRKSRKARRRGKGKSLTRPRPVVQPVSVRHVEPVEVPARSLAAIMPTAPLRPSPTTRMAERA